MSQPTQRYKRTLKGSIGSGMQSLMGSERRFYILEHKVSSKYHKAGENQQIIVDQIELGRASTCQVRFDESFSTVSRRHAAIVKDGDNWKLVQLSQTNSTFLNGHRIEKEWYLQNGDEIQLSVNGPKMGFITLAGKKGTVGSLGLTRRLSLFRQQALRPYKYAIVALSCLLVLAVGGLGTWNYMLHQSLVNQSKSLAEQIIAAKGNKHLVDSLTQELAKVNAELVGTNERVKTISRQRASGGKTRVFAPSSSAESSSAKADITQCYPYVYLVEVNFELDGKVYDGWSGTGFLLSNGYFVTAQHCIHWDDYGLKKVKGEDGKEQVAIDPEAAATILNVAYYSNNLKMIMTCTSTTDQFKIEYTYGNMPFRLGSIKPNVFSFDYEGASYVIATHNKGYNSSADWACIKTDRKGGLDFDSSYSMNMPPQVTLHILGFPANQGTRSPIYSSTVTARKGLESNGIIKTSNYDADHGNSGGPVMVEKNGKYKVIGILSGGVEGSDNAHIKGRIVPIGAAF